MLPNTSTSRPNDRAEPCHFPAHPVHSPAPPIHRQMLLQIVRDCDPALLSPDAWCRGRTSNRKSERERKSRLQSRPAISFLLAATFQPASTSATTQPSADRWAGRPAAAKT